MQIINRQHRLIKPKRSILKVKKKSDANAIKYHNPYISDRYVKIEGGINDVGFSITISDNGIGIKDEHIENIFDMFFRATQKSEGSGLGLYIVKETLEKLNGSVKCKSSPEKGTTFEILLPLNRK